MCAESLIAVLIGPGGVGKGTLARRLVAREGRLWLSRSWTTRPRRESEDGSEYVFVDRAAFEAAAAQGRFLEWAQFHGNLYGTPTPEPTPDHDILLEIDVQGAEQVRARHPDAAVFLILPPSREELEARLRGRGDEEAHVEARLALEGEEVARGRALGAYEIVNDDVERAASQILSILEGLRRRRSGSREKD